MIAFIFGGTAGIGSQLHDLQAVMGEHSGPIILVGDFNAWSAKRLKLVQALADGSDLTEVTDFSSDRKTADMGSSFFNGLLGIDAGLALDRVYYRGFTHHSAKVLSYESSDHRAIQVTLDLAPASN